MVTVLDILEQHQISLAQTGSRYSTNCPLIGHIDDSPSFVVYSETNSFYCFGCHRGGGPLQLLMYLTGISREDACDKLGMNNFEYHPEDTLPKIEKDFNTNLNFVISSNVCDYLQKNPNNWEKIAPFLKQFDKRLATEKLDESQAKEILDESRRLLSS